jgi:hypothetical protein
VILHVPEMHVILHVCACMHAFVWVCVNSKGENTARVLRKNWPRVPLDIVIGEDYI